MLDLNAINNQSIYVDEDLVYLDSLMIRLDCAASIYNRFAKDIECSTEDLKSFANSAINWIRTFIDKIIAGFKYLLELFKNIPKMLAKFKTASKNRKEFNAKANILIAWLNKLVDINKNAQETKRLDELRNITNEYVSKWEQPSGSEHAFASENLAEQLREAISECNLRIQSLSEIKTRILNSLTDNGNSKSKYDSPNTQKFSRDINLYKILYKKITQTDANISQMTGEQLKAAIRDLLSSISKRQHAFAIWFKYARKTLDIEQSAATGKENQKGFLYFYEIPQTVRAYLANYFKEFYNTKGHGALRTKKICVLSNTNSYINGTKEEHNAFSSTVIINLNLFLNNSFDKLAETILHELTHASQSMHKELKGKRIQTIDNNDTSQLSAKEHDNDPSEKHADKASFVFVQRVKDGKIPENNPFYEWLHKVKQAIEQRVKATGYKSSNKLSMKIEKQYVENSMHKRRKEALKDYK